MVTGGLLGVMLCEYYVINPKSLDIRALYASADNAVYWFRSGVNWYAVVSVVAGTAPCVPGFVMSITSPSNVTNSSDNDRGLSFFPAIYNMSWFVSLAISSSLYAVLSRKRSLQSQSIASVPLLSPSHDHEPEIQ